MPPLKKNLQKFTKSSRIGKIYVFLTSFFNKTRQITSDINADKIQKLTALFHENLSIIYPVPTPESIDPIYPNIPQKPVTAEATFLELDSTAESPPIKT